MAQIISTITCVMVLITSGILYAGDPGHPKLRRNAAIRERIAPRKVVKPSISDKIVCSESVCIDEKMSSYTYCLFGRKIYTSITQCTVDQACIPATGKCAVLVATDGDNDGVSDTEDSCPDTHAGIQVNINGCPDGDGDAIADTDDNCINMPNQNQKDSDKDGDGDACDDDDDGDEVADVADNCPLVINTTQMDSDNDGEGDACDDDDDGDQIADSEDNCPLLPGGSQTDTDHDGMGDQCDLCPDSMYGDWDGDGTCDDSNRICTVPSFPEGNQLYVAVSGSDEAGDGTDGNPWRYLSYAVEQAPDNAVIHLGEGVFYGGCFVRVDKNLTIVGSGRDKTTIDDNLLADTSGYGCENLFLFGASGHSDERVLLKLQSLTVHAYMMPKRDMIYLNNATFVAGDVNFKMLVGGDNEMIAARNSSVVIDHSKMKSYLNPSIDYTLSARDGTQVCIENSTLEDLSGQMGVMYIDGSSKLWFAHNRVTGFGSNYSSFEAPPGLINGHGELYFFHNYISQTDNAYDFSELCVEVGINDPSYVLGNTFKGCDRGIHIKGPTYVAYNHFLDSKTAAIYLDDTAGGPVYGNARPYIGATTAFNEGYNLFNNADQYEVFIKSTLPNVSVLVAGSAANNFWIIDDVLSKQKAPIKEKVFDSEDSGYGVKIPVMPVAKEVLDGNFGGGYYPGYIVKALGKCEYKNSIAGIDGDSLSPSLPDCLSDGDGDGIPYLIDNCPFLATDQLLDADLNHVGDACQL